MANTKKPTKAKAKVKVKPKPAVGVETEVQEDEPVSQLTKAEEFYIENNLNKTDVEIAQDLGKSLPDVRNFIHNTRNRGESRIGRLLIREKGCVIMTAGASEAADQSRKGYVSQQAINDAASRGDYEEAARLKGLMQQRQSIDDREARKRQEGHIHYIHHSHSRQTDVRK